VEFEVKEQQIKNRGHQESLAVERARVSVYAAQRKGSYREHLASFDAALESDLALFCGAK
jgi:hypothetical protein